MTIEDYTSVYFGAIKRQPTPAVYDGKFVHVTSPNGAFLLFAPMQFCKYHAHIVAHFSSLHKEVSFILSGDDGHFRTPGWSIRGGGKFRLDSTRRIIWLWGSSKAYGAFDGTGIGEQLRDNEAWGAYEIRLSEPN
ncbi:MAG: hypothetical protein HZB43_08400 [candidate division Zixibacteria bacterium]|nr:hypothetical protein [candidate division Zixibacteria bacterium]